jgi:hypothetical protein
MLTKPTEAAAMAETEATAVAAMEETEATEAIAMKQKTKRAITREPYLLQHHPQHQHHYHQQNHHHQHQHQRTVASVRPSQLP